jgi:hypothetical protein
MELPPEIASEIRWRIEYYRILGPGALGRKVMGDAALCVISCSLDRPAGTEIGGIAVSWLYSP